MPKKKIVLPENIRTMWMTGNITSHPILSVDDRDEIEKPAAKSETKAFQKPVVAPREALESFLNSICFAEYLCKTYANPDLSLALYPHYRKCGYAWDVTDAAGQEAIILNIPRIDDDLYSKLYKEYGSYVLIGNAYKKHPLFDAEREMLRAQLEKVLEEKIA